ncbi:MAG: wax ester/triacylglycerol synthase family O-acyltransferase [Myxococcales bacterium]|nr:wax ester/triacylglycerol synthase family O-acyltransferase [Myxococcales bacterium]
MPRYNYERLSGQDTTFLLWETPSLHMHVASTHIFELGPLATEEGGVAFEEFKRFTESVLHRIPRYRQKLKWIPIEDRPVWVDDAHFSIDYHLRHTSLPKPGSEQQLKKLAARVMAQQLDRDRPLWEIWVVEGLERERFAMISKVHHCMIDGASGIDISQILMRTTPDRTIKRGPRYIPRPEPTRRELLLDAARDRIGLPLRVLRSFREFRRETENLRDEIALRTGAVRDAIASQFSAAPQTPINGPLGPHRLFDWWSVPLADMKALRRAFDCTVNDVVLTVVTGAFREFLGRRQVRPDEIDFRVQAPVSVRSARERGRLGNRVSAWLVRLPVGEPDPRKQLERIHATTQELKDSHQALGADMILSVMELMPNALLSLGAQAASGTMNSIVTNVPGPQFPLYALGSELLAMYPQVPLLRNVGLGIALISYNGRVCWGFNADLGLVPDLADFVALIRKAFERLAEVAEVKLSPPDARVGA